MSESPRHELDAAIDRVAARMVAVREDDSLLSRTMAQLPGREATPWFMSFRLQAAAAAAVLLVAFVFARPLPDSSRTDAPGVAVTAPVVAAIPVPRSLTPVPRSLFPDPRSPIPDPRFPIPDPRSLIPEPRSPFPATAVARQVPPRRAPVVLDRPDHERSLAPVDAIDALELVGIAPLSMELDATAAPEPLVVTELTLDPKGDS